MSKQYGFTKENKGAVDAALDFPRLKLQKKGEVARLAIFGIDVGDDGKRKLGLPNPEGGYYFDLRIPGAEREFVGSFECLADEATKAEDGYDPDACAHCAAVLSGEISEEVMRKRVRRFVMPVIRYKTKANSSDLIEPASVEAVAWKFTDRYFNVIVDEHEKWSADGDHGLLAHDLTLTCEAVQYQNFTVSVEPYAAYVRDKDIQRLVVETYISQTAGLVNGLGRVLGNKLPNVDLERKIAETVEAAAQLGIGGPTSATVPTMDPETVAALASDLLGDTSEVVTEAAPVQTEIEVTAEAEVPDVQAESAEEPVTVASDGEVDFDDFFSS